MADTYDANGQRITAAPTFIPATGDGTKTVRDNNGNIVSSPTSSPAPAPAPTTPAKPQITSSAMPQIQKGIDTATDTAKNNLNPSPAPTAPAKPTLPVGYATNGQVDNNGNITITNNQNKVVYTGPQDSDYTSTMKNVDTAQRAVAASLGAGYTVAADSSGMVHMTDPDGNPIGTPLAPTSAGDPTAVATWTGAVQTYTQTKTNTATALSAQTEIYKTQLNLALEDIAKQRAAAQSSGAAGAGVNAGLSTGARSEASAIDARFDKLVQQANDTYNNAVNTATANANNTNQNALTAMNDAIKNIEQTAQSNVLATDKFNQTIKQQGQTAFMSNLKNFDTSSLSDAGRADLIKQGVSAGLTEDGAADFIDAQSLAQKKLDQTTLNSTLAGYDLSKIDKMTLEQAKADTGLIGTAMKQASAVLGSDKAAYEAIQGSFKQQKTALDFQKEQAQIASSQIYASLAPERMQMAEMNYGINTTQKLISDATKPNAWGTVLNNIAAQMPKIESAYQTGGKGVSALTMIDALVKIDTDGQAIRQGQTNLLQESGTWGDSANRIMAKIGLDPSKSGANTVLTKNQVEQIYALAKSTAAEKVKANMPGYTAFKTGVETLKTNFPQTAADVGTTAASFTANMDQFISKYGTGGESVGGGAITAQSILDKYKIK